MASIAALNCFTPECSGIGSNNSQFSVSTLNDFRVSQQRSFDISLTTTDSDRVTIHSSSQIEASYSAYNQQGIIDGNAFDVSVRSSAYSKTSSFSLTVEGTLDKEEARDINKAVRQVSKFMRRIQAGDLKHAIRRIAKLDKLDSLSGLQATLQSSRHVSVTQQTEVASGTSSSLQGEETIPAAEV